MGEIALLTDAGSSLLGDASDWIAIETRPNIKNTIVL